MKRLGVIFILVFYFGLINFSYARRARLDVPVFNYQTIINAIAEGKVLVPGDKNHPLNNILSNFRGQYALYYLARALDEAVADGKIKWEGGLTSFETNRLNKLPNEYIKMLGARETAISYRKFFQWKQEIESDLAEYSGNEGQVHFAFDYGVENIARLSDIFGERYGWSKLHVTLRKISKAVDLFEENPFLYKGENGQKELAEAAHISHPGVLYYARGEFEGYSQDSFGWSKDVFTVRELEKIRQEMDALSIESGINVLDLEFMVHEELFNLVQQYGRGEIVAFLRNVGDLGMSFISQDEENTARLFQLAQQDDWRDIVTDYLAINSGIAECYKIYGTEARALSRSDEIAYQEILKQIDNTAGSILHQVNDLIIACALNQSSGARAVAARAQEDFKTILNVLSLYKSGKLEEDIRLDIPSYMHTFNTKTGDFSEISLCLHEEETAASEASIRWKIEHVPSEIVSLRLDKDRHTHQLYLDISSSALDETYKILGRESGHHFKINAPVLVEADIFKILVRIFYRRW